MQNTNVEMFRLNGVTLTVTSHDNQVGDEVSRKVIVCAAQECTKDIAVHRACDLVRSLVALMDQGLTEYFVEDVDYLAGGWVISFRLF